MEFTIFVISFLEGNIYIYNNTRIHIYITHIAMCNHTSYAQVHELPQNYCGDNREGTLFSW